MSQSNPTLDLPAGPETASFRAFERVLKDDPILGPAVKTWVTWTGSNDDLLEPTFSSCPYLRLSPYPTSSDWVSEGQHKMPLTVNIQAAVAGTRADNLLNLWNAVRLALFPQSSVAAAEAVRTVLQAAGVSKPTLRISAYAVGIDEKSGCRLLIADGTIEFNMLIST
jgi:hypothetical protein